jgi:SAM-dependent methyltransferase
MTRTPVDVDAIWEVAEECGVCGGRERRVLFAVLGKRYARCGGCAVVRLLDRVRPERLDLLYGHYYPPDDVPPAELEAQLGNPAFAHRRRRLEAALPPGERRIFEVGAGDGNFLASLRRHGWSVAGSEWSADSVDLVRRRHGIALREGDVTAMDVPAGAFGVVAAYHVLEHVYAPRAWLRATRRLVAPGGVLHLQVPNHGALLARLAGTLSPALVFPQHVYLYTPRTLAALLRAEGFEAVSLTTFDPWHGPGTAASTAANLARRLLDGRDPWEGAVGPGAMDGGGAADGQAGGAGKRNPAGRIARALFGPLAHGIARAEAWVGMGAVVDVVARPVG